MAVSPPPLLVDTLPANQTRTLRAFTKEEEEGLNGTLRNGKRRPDAMYRPTNEETASLWYTATPSPGEG